MSSLISKAFEELYNKPCTYATTLTYSGAFKGYNANVRYGGDFLHFRISRRWKSVSDDIQIGLIQALLNKVFKTAQKSMNIDFYYLFLKNVHISAPRCVSDPGLVEVFKNINDEYFNGMMLQPNLVFGGNNFHTLGTYDYATDTITLSKVLGKEPRILEYIMYHEMLHKKLKFQHTGKKTMHHSRTFKQWERKFKVKDIEKKLISFLRREKYKSHLRIE